MPSFAISVVDSGGVRQKLRMDAPDIGALRQALLTRSLWPVRIEPVDSGWRLARTTIPVPELVAVLQQLEMQLNAGVTADAALRQLAEDAPSEPARIILRRISDDVSHGTPINVACRFFHRQFPPHVAAVIAAGETSAQLPAALRALTEHLANVEELRRTARRALIYPLIVLAATAGLIVFLLGGVVPQFASIFTSLRMTLPWPTLVLITASEVVRGWWLIVLVATVLGSAAAAASLRFQNARRWRDRALLWLPLVGETVQHLATARFAAHLRLLHDAGVPVLDALATGAELTANAVLSRNVLAAREGVARGLPLHAALPQGHAFPRFVIPALKSGEGAGQLGQALRHIEAYAAAHSRARIALAVALLEPVLLSLLTGIVGFIALSFFLPMFELMGGIR
jgi:type II secretory pathway component PulF